MSNKKEFIVNDLFYPHPLKRVLTKEIKTGEIGVVVLGLKTVDDIMVGDTITDANKPTQKPIDGFESAKSFVFAGLYNFCSKAIMVLS